MKHIIISFLCLLGFSLQSQIIVIDPGHGYNASGGNPDGRSYIENTTSLLTGLKLKALIDNDCPNWTAYMTRSTANGWISLSQRASMSNSWNADYYLSIHCNSAGGTGTETFWCSNNDPSSTDDIAFAQQIQAKMVLHGQWANRRCVEDASYIWHLAVLSGSSATGCLNEIGFDDSLDSLKLKSNAWQDSFALAYKKAIENLEGVCTSTISPTINNECSNATELFSNTSCNYVSGTLLGATQSFSVKASCDGFSGTPAMKDVFYYFIANSTTHTVEVNPVGTDINAVDAIISVYSGSNCANLTEVGCGGGTGSGAGGATKFAYLSNLTVGQKYWIRIYDHGTIDPTNYDFEICLTSTIVTGIMNQLEKKNMVISPNPNNGIFQVKYVSDKTEYDYQLFNSLSQQVQKGKITSTNNSIDISEQANGIYFIVLKHQNKTDVYKLIKN